MKYNIAGLIIGILASVSFVQGQEKRMLTLNEAIDLSVKNSHQLKNSQAKIEEATAALKEAREKKLPGAGISGSYLRLNSANIDLKTSSHGGNGSTGSGVPKISQAMYGILNASLPVYAGGRIKYGIESSRYLEQAAKLDAENNKDEVIQNTIEAFANLNKAGSTVNLVKENLLQSQQRVKDFRNMEKNGLLARNDLLKIELQSSNIELSLLDAENNRELADENMNLLLGLPATTELVLDTTAIEQKVDNRALEDYIQVATNNRKDMAATGLRKKAEEIGVKSVKSEMYPNVELTGGYIAADVPHLLTITNAVKIGVGVSYNIGSLWSTKAKQQQAEAKVKQAMATEVMLSDNIRLQVQSCYLSMINNRKKIEVYEKAITQAEENYRIVKNKFDNSLATTTDLLEADVAQLQAKLNYTIARADAFVAYNKLLQTVGILSSDLNK